MGITHTPVTIKTPVKATVDVTAIESAIMDKVGPILVDIISELTDFQHNATEPSDCDPGFEVTGTVIQEGTLIHIDACGLEPPEDSVEPDDIEIDETQLLEKLQQRIINHTSGDMWKHLIYANLSLQLKADKSDRILDEIEY